MGAIVKKFIGFIRTADGHGSFLAFFRMTTLQLDGHFRQGARNWKEPKTSMLFFFWKVKETSLQIKVSFCCCGIPCRIHTLGQKSEKPWFFLQKNPEALFIFLDKIIIFINFILKFHVFSSLKRVWPFLKWRFLWLPYASWTQRFPGEFSIQRWRKIWWIRWWSKQIVSQVASMERRASIRLKRWGWLDLCMYTNVHTQICVYIYMVYIYIWHVYIYMGSGRFPGPMELLLQQLVRVSKTRWRWFNLNKSMLLQPLIKKLEVLVMIKQWTTYCINDNNDKRWMVVLIDFYWTFCKNQKKLFD